MEFFFQVSLREFGQKYFTPLKIACSYTYVLHHHMFRDLLVLF